ncbi:hypothetical protein [Vibrio phage LP.1]|nr:hypothetical protein [Vibrio phage LP.1]
MKDVGEFNIKFINMMLAGEQAEAMKMFNEFTGITHSSDRGLLLEKSIQPCQRCGCDTEVLFFEYCVSKSYCNQCDQEIWNEIRQHEEGLISSGYYG